MHHRNHSPLSNLPTSGVIAFIQLLRLPLVLMFYHKYPSESHIRFFTHYLYVRIFEGLVYLLKFEIFTYYLI